MEVNKVYLGDCVAIMKTLPDNSTELVFVAVLFNIGFTNDDDKVILMK